MRFRFGLILGFGSGYYLGAQAGRERYEQMNAALRRVKRSEPYEDFIEKASDVADLATEKAADIIGSRSGENGADVLTDPSPYSSSR